MKLILLPALPRLWRDRSTVQLGIDPRHSTLLEFADPKFAGVLNLLDGTRTETQVAREATPLDISTTEVRRMVNLLRAAGLVIDQRALLPSDLPEGAARRLRSEADALALRHRTGDRSPAGILRRRRRSTVLIRGQGRMAAVVGSLLAASGVGRIQTDVHGAVTEEDAAPGGLLPADVGQPRGIAIAEAVRRAAPDVDLRPLRDTLPDLAILVGTPCPPPATALRYALRRVPHLTVWLRDGVVVLGPLVRPGESTCLDCVNLHRQSRDRHWPVLAAQLATSPRHHEPAEAGVVALGASLTAIQALRHLDGELPETVGRTLEVTPSGQIRRRTWPPHPNCGCVRRR